jgi:hypothetical protein
LQPISITMMPKRFPEELRFKIDGKTEIFATHLGKERHGAYVGFEFGKVRKCGDWAVKGEVEYVQAFCFPQYDNAGIGINVGNKSLYDLEPDAKLGWVVVTSNTRSFLNYWGPKVELAYALTDDLSARIQYMTSWEIRKILGFRYHYQRLEAKLIYSF